MKIRVTGSVNVPIAFRSNYLSSLTVSDIRVLQMLMERRGIDTIFEKLETNSSNNGEEIFRSTLVACRKRSIVNFLLLTRTSVTRKVIRQARKLGMISPTYSWLILNPVSKK